MKGRRVLVTGTEPGRETGGVGTAVEAFLEAMDASRWECMFVPSYRPASFLRRQIQFLLAAARVAKEGGEPGTSIAYSHAGGWLSMLREFFVLTVANARGLTTIMHLHSADVGALSRGPVGRALLQAIAASVDRVVVVSGYWSQLLEERLEIRASPVRNALTASTLCAGESAVEARTDGKPPPLRVLAMTRLVEGKGLEAIVRYAASAEYSEFVIAGEGPLRRSLRELSSSLGACDRVRFPGWIHGRRKREELAGADVFCLPSSYESFGLGYLEAMAYGLPVIALDVPQIRELFGGTPGVVLIDRACPEDIGQAIASVRAPDLRREMSRSVREFVEARFSPGALREELEVLLDDVVGAAATS